MCCFIESKLNIFIIGNICLDIIRLSVSASFTEACPAVLQSTRRWRPALAVFVPCSLCHVSYCVTICCLEGFSVFTAQQFSALAFTHQTCQRQMVGGVALRCFHKCQGFQTLCILCFGSHLFTIITIQIVSKQLSQ